MIGQLLKRVVKGAVLFAALVAFFQVPMGSKTGAEHVVAILSTRPAKEAGKAVADTAKSLAARAEVDLAELRAAHEDSPRRSRERAER